jgi:CubicO group peptidase (beta-lactamase class C family)
VNWFGRIVRGTGVLAAIVIAPPTFTPMLQAAAGANHQQSTILRLERDVPELMKRNNVPGVSLALIQRGKTIWVHGFGVKEAGTSQPVDGETVFEAASLSKPVFAYAVLKLVDQGKLALDVPLTTYLPKPYIAGDPRLSKITARIVLSHRTGFPNWRNGDALPIYFTPGERFSYSGEGYIYLQRVVEQITGKPLNAFMHGTLLSQPGGAKFASRIISSLLDLRRTTIGAPPCADAA